MNISKITCEFLFSRRTISELAETSGTTKADVVKAIFSFLKTFPQSSHKPAIQRRLKGELAKDFLKAVTSTERFAEEYGMDALTFRKLMREAIDDNSIIVSDVVAEKLFRKVMTGTIVAARYVPKRIVKQIAFMYTSSNPYTQDGLASIYGTRRETIAAILKRGISENIVDDVTAEKIIVRIRQYIRCVDAYSDAFDKREQTKLKQKTQS